MVVDCSFGVLIFFSCARLLAFQSPCQDSSAFLRYDSTLDDFAERFGDDSRFKNCAGADRELLFNAGPNFALAVCCIKRRVYLGWSGLDGWKEPLLTLA